MMMEIEEPTNNAFPLPTVFCHSERTVGGETTSLEPKQDDIDTQEYIADKGDVELLNEESFDWGAVENITEADLQGLELLGTGETVSVGISGEDIIIPTAPLEYLLDEIDGIEDDIEDIEMTTKSLGKKAGTLLARYRSSAGLAVTKLVSPLWYVVDLIHRVIEVHRATRCQYKTNYDLVGEPDKGSKERPKEFTVKRKELIDERLVIKEVVIKVNIKVAEARDISTSMGRAIHEKLEKEVAPEPIRIVSSSKEEKWGSRILSLIKGFRQLSDTKLWREFPVFGIIDDIPIVGVIDKLELRPSDSKYRLIMSDIKTKRKKGTSQQHLSATPEHKFQLMLYKKLLDALISPEYDWSGFFKLHRLNPETPFSDNFMAQIAEETNLSNLAASCTTLGHLVEVWKSDIQKMNISKGQTDSTLRVEFITRGGREQVSIEPGDTTPVKIQAFRYDPSFVTASLATSLGFWLGTQPMRGVGIEETWKCNACEYKENCEWRQGEASRLGQIGGTSRAKMSISMENFTESR
ncbi:hypothetical protein FRC17_000574 [Serendipita sp. 399]|nr:hypothetical protein FRC17_000574 [Serendipita sp. 399]